MSVKIRLRRDLSLVWQLVNPLLLDGEPAFETDTGKMKIGDGEKTYNALPYTSGLKVEGLTEYLGKPNGIAPLNEDKTIPSEYLPAISVPDNIPKGVIVMWSGTLATIPAGWALCDGTNGTPDLQNKFIRGATTATLPGTKGGADTVTLATTNLPSHAHTTTAGPTGLNLSATASIAATATDSTGLAGLYVPIFENEAHLTSVKLANATPTTANVSRFLCTAVGYNFGISVVGSGTHTHTGTVSISGNGTTATTGSGQAINILPTYYTLAYIIKI